MTGVDHMLMQWDDEETRDYTPAVVIIIKLHNVLYSGKLAAIMFDESTVDGQSFDEEKFSK